MTGSSEEERTPWSSAHTKMSSVPSSPNKRVKIQDQEDSEDNLHLPPPSFEDDQPDSCGICYADRGTSIRGEIDCCNHFFCFVCIMEWSKHESRCPLCRQRFSTVHRSPKTGVFPSSRLVKVPIRDQVYHVDGNITTGPADPYAETRCSVCNSEEDEIFLLLCDLCDTASHTYCVGLGYVVPEGDWFCRDCTVSRAINDNNNVDHQRDIPTAEPSVTILDIVRGPNSQMAQRSRPAPRVTPLPHRVNEYKDRNPNISVTPLPERVNRNSDVSARTLRQCRNVQRNIQALRQNWNALRNGSLRFSSASSESGVRHDKRQNTDSSPHGKSDQLHSLASTSLQQSIIQSSPSNNRSNEGVSEDVNKAWKMLKRARMTEKINHKCSNLPQSLDHPSRAVGTRKAPGNHCNGQELKIYQFGRSTGNEKQYSFSSFNKDMDNRGPLQLGGKRHSGVTHKGTAPNIRDQASHLEECCEPSFPRKMTSNILCAPHHENGERNFVKEQSRSSCSVTSVGSAPSYGKIGNVSSSSRDAGKKKRLPKNFGDANTLESEDAKNEIKSLVKLNLKVLSRDKPLGLHTCVCFKSLMQWNHKRDLLKLEHCIEEGIGDAGVNAFKEIARHSTHSILAACRSEHEKRSVSSSSSICSHGGENEHFHKSTLMPDCCRRCFYMFVQTVVSSTMMEKVGGA